MVMPQDLPTDPGFARRVEQAETAAWLDLESAVSGPRVIETHAIDDAILVLNRANDWPRSRILNLGSQRPATPETMEMIISAARQAGVTTLATDVTPIARPGTIARILAGAGFSQTDRNVVVARHTADMPEPDSYFRLRLAEPVDLPPVIELMKRVMLEGPDWIALLAGQIGRPKWRFYLATEANTPSGIATIHEAGDIAWLSPIWVAEEYRNRGAQAALIAYAVREAANLGVQWVTTSYPATLPGRTRNFERLGFSMVYQRRHFIWEDPSR